MADAVAEAPTEVAAPPSDEAKVEPKKPSKPKDGGKGDAKKKDAKKAKASGTAAAGGPNVAAHPRAARSTALVKSWCGLIGFLLAGYSSLPTSTLVGVGLRALAAGVICYVAGWGAAVFVWRRLVVLEIKAREQQLVSDLLARHAALGAPRQSGGLDAP